MIALGVKAPQSNPLGSTIAQNAQMINMMRQQDAAERQAAAAAQQMQLAQTKEAREAALAKPQLDKANSDANSARLKYVMDFFDASALSIAKSEDAEHARAIGERLMSMFPEPEFKQSIAETLASIPDDPNKFPAWKEDALVRTLDAAKQTEKDFTTQNLGTSTRVLATPKYGSGPGRVVEGSEAEVAFKPTVLNVEGIGGVVVDPNTGRGYPVATGSIGGYTRPGAGGGLVGGKRGGDTFSRMVDAESGNKHFAESGSPITSPKGAVGVAQVMPSTAPEAARLAGLPFDENRYRTDPAYNRALGEAYFKKQLADFGDERLAAAAYNAGPGAVRRALQKGGPDGWLNYVPRETQDYVAKVFSGAGQPNGKPGAAPMTTEQAASAQEKQRKVKTFQDLTGVNLQSGEDPVEALIKGSTSGRIEALGADILGAIPEQLGGGATKGMENIGKLEALASTLTLQFAPGGRLSTGVSNEDRAKIEQQLGKIEDPNIPAGKRLAAWQQVKAIMARTIGITPKSAPVGGSSRPAPSPADVQAVRRNRDKKEWTEGFRRQFGDEALRKALGGR